MVSERLQQRCSGTRGIATLDIDMCSEWIVIQHTDA